MIWIIALVGAPLTEVITTEMLPPVARVLPPVAFEVAGVALTVTALRPVTADPLFMTVAVNDPLAHTHEHDRIVALLH